MSYKKNKKKQVKIKRLISRQIMDVLIEESRPLNHKQISKRLGVRDGLTQKLVVQLLDDLAKKGRLEVEDRGKYRAKISQVTLEGRIDFTRKGSAYVISEDAEQDIFIPAKAVGKALHGDLVKIQVSGKRSSRGVSGSVSEVLERVRTSFVGTMHIQRNHAFMVPDNPSIHIDFYIPKQKLNGAEHGQKVIAKIVDWPSRADSPFGEIVEVLGEPGDLETETHAILANYGFPRTFPEEVEAAAAAIPLEIPKSEIKKRRDFRNIETFTIDPEDAKDFDDALSFQTLPSGNVEIGVHIADVTHYVTPGSAIEREAISRATSVYLVDQVIPMLPEVLSNKVCSLRPKEEKLCFSAVFEIDKQAKVVNHWIGRTVIYSDHRFTYEQAQEVLESGEGLHKEALLTINKLAKTLRKKRMDTGAIAFDKVEVKFKLDEKKQPIQTIPKVQQDAHKLIEEFMLLANRTVAEQIGKKKGQEQVKTFVYRIHDGPDPEKKAEFIQFIRQLGYTFNANAESAGNSFAKALNQLLKETKGKPEENMIDKLAIRTMSKAIYSTENVGHYGLSFQYYTHFTSPIRRYPDIMVHRLLDAYAQGGKSAQQRSIEKSARHSSDMEKKATEAERESIKYYQVLFLKNRLGEVFEGVVSGVSEWGVYVELIENKCEGMVRLRDIEHDHYYLDEKKHRVIGHQTGNIIQLGDKINVKVAQADPQLKRLDFELML